MLQFIINLLAFNAFKAITDFIRSNDLAHAKKSWMFHRQYYRLRPQEAGEDTA